MCTLGKFRLVMAILVVSIMVSVASATIVSMGDVTAVNGDEMGSASYGLWAYNYAESANPYATEMIVDMGQIKTTTAILFKNMPWDGFQAEEPGDLRIYIADDESAGLASSFTHEITNGRTPMDVDNRGIANAWETWTLPSVITKRYVKIDITGNRMSGSTTLHQWGDIAAIPEPATMLLLGLGGLVLRRRCA